MSGWMVRPPDVPDDQHCLGNLFRFGTLSLDYLFRCQAIWADLLLQLFSTVKIIHKRNKCELINQSISNKYNIFIFISWNHLVTSMTKIKHCDHFFGYKIYKLLFEKFVDIKEVIRSRKSKTEIQYKVGQTKKVKHTTQKTKDWGYFGLLTCICFFCVLFLPILFDYIKKKPSYIDTKNRCLNLVKVFDGKCVRRHGTLWSQSHDCCMHSVAIANKVLILNLAWYKFIW
jgi:hypothetical protein